MLNSPLISAVNHLLQTESWAREALAPHAGKSARLSLPPVDLDITVLPDGRLDAAEGVPETRIRATPSALVKSLGGEMAEIGIEGDVAFAKTLSFLLRNLRWDYEADLARLTGDVLAHRFAGAASTLFSWQKKAAWNLLGNFAEYWTEERPLLAKSGGISKFLGDVDAIRDDAARIEKRIEKLEGRS